MAPTMSVDATSQQHLEDALNEVAGHLNAQHGRLVDLVIEMLADESTWCGPGVHTPELYLAWRVGLSAPRARQIVTIARRADEFPTCVEAFRRGELAVDQMAAIAHRAPWWTDVEICELGRSLTVGQLRNTLAKYPFPDIPRPDAEPAQPADDANDADDRPTRPTKRVRPTTTSVPASRSRAATEPTPVDRFWFGIGDDGRFRANLECDQLTGMIIEAALRQARDSRFQDGQADVDWVDAIREMAERSLDSVTEPSRRDRFRIGIHLATDGSACDAHGWTLPDAIRRYVTCDGLLVPHVRALRHPDLGRAHAAHDPRAHSAHRRAARPGMRRARMPADPLHRDPPHHPLGGRWADGYVESDRTLPAPPPSAPQGRTRDRRQRRRTRRRALHQPTRSSDRHEWGETHAPRGTTADSARGLPAPGR